uniref:Uncharacterized protein n=1 Tax=Tetranychus urticae TaxID=32264 RepID=T1KX35_TETUR
MMSSLVGPLALDHSKETERFVTFPLANLRLENLRAFRPEPGIDDILNFFVASNLSNVKIPMEITKKTNLSMN